jgi:5'-methylthioadenosine phosphorylase
MQDYSWTIGVIGGSGLYDLDELENRDVIKAQSPWGEASGKIVSGSIGDVRLVFLPRHGEGHRIPPSAINARANIDILKRAGCTDILSFSAVGSLRETLAPETFIVVDQFIDRTVSRPSSFFGPGLVAHVSLADPVCKRLSQYAFDAALSAGTSPTMGGVYLAMEGPQFSTRAESNLYRSWGCSVIGMTAMPEVRLAREAELPYASICMITDYDCWREHDSEVDVSSVLTILKNNANAARRTLRSLIDALPATRSASPIDNCLDYAIVTDPNQWDAELRKKLAGICPRKFT